MADATYQPKVYKEQGGDVLRIISGGTLNLEAGATLTNAATQAQSGAVTQTGVTTLSGAGRIRHAVTAGTTAGTGVIPPAGIATITSTGAAEVFKMTGAPTAGDILHVSCLKATSTGTCTLQAATGVTFSSTAAKLLLVFNTDNVMATLVAVSATRYALTNSTAYVPTST